MGLIGAALAAAGVHVWLDVLPHAERERVTIVGSAESAEIAGQRFELGPVRWEEFDAPEGSRTLSVHLDARPGADADAAACGAFTLTEADGGRVWLDARDDLDVPYDAGERYCLEESGPYGILAVFLVPDDAVGPFHFDIPGPDDETARFVIEP